MMEDRILFLISEEAWLDFQALLEREYDPKEYPKMSKLLRMKSPFFED